MSNEPLRASDFSREPVEWFWQKRIPRGAAQTDRMSYLARAKAALPEYASELDHA
jgi:hypothetical protein